jgi:hypothetical protein
VGGGLFVGEGADGELMRVTFGRNSAPIGGAIATRGDLMLSNTTIDRNVSKLGVGGIAVLGAGATAIHTTTISENGAVNLDATENTGELSLSSTIVWGAETADCMGDAPSAGGNLEGGTSCGFTGTNDQQGLDPLLGPLNNYGGLVPTRPLGTGSPAIDHGIDDFESQCPRDARNQGRFRTTDDGVADTDAGATDFPGEGVFGAVEITSAAPTTATQNEPFVYDVEATNDVRPQCIAFSLGGEGFVVPEGVEIDERTGLITWTPPFSGEARFPVNASDPGGGSGDQQVIDLDIAPAP